MITTVEADWIEWNSGEWQYKNRESTGSAMGVASALDFHLSLIHI